MTAVRWTILAMVLLSGAGLYGAFDDMPFLGSAEDIRLLPPQTLQAHEFTFVRLIYNGRLPSYYKNWYTDYPEGDQHLIDVLRRMIRFDIAPEGRAIPIQHPDLFNYPFVFSLEGGQMALDDRDAERLRSYLMRGGFWMIDDFWGAFEWKNFESQMRKVLPGRQIVDLPLTHPIFDCFFTIDEIIQVPNVGIAWCPDCPTWEQDGYVPAVKGILDETGRLLVLITFNTDLMDGSEWADEPNYPEKYSAFAFKMFSNAVVYSMTH